MLRRKRSVTQRTNTHKHTLSIAVLKVRPATGQHSNSPHTIAFASVRSRSAGTWPTQGNQSTRSLALARSRSLSKERRLEKCKQARQRSLTKAAQLILVLFFLFFCRFRLQLQLQLICMRHRSELWMRFRRGLQLKIGTRTKGVCAASVCVQCVCVCGVLCKSLSRQTVSR